MGQGPEGLCKSRWSRDTPQTLLPVVGRLWFRPEAIKASNNQGQQSGGLDAHQPHPQPPASPTSSTCWMPRLGRPHPAAQDFLRLAWGQLAWGTRGRTVAHNGSQNPFPARPRLSCLPPPGFPYPAQAGPQRRASEMPPGLWCKTRCPPRRSLQGQRP